MDLCLCPLYSAVLADVLLDNGITYMSDIAAPSEFDDQDLLLSKFGTVVPDDSLPSRYPRRADALYGMRLQLNSSYHRLVWNAKRMPVQRILVTSVDVPNRREGLEAVLAALKRTRHDVTVSVAPIGDRGKFQNINLALRDVDLSAYDWLIVVDDDIAFPPHFLDRFVYACAAADLRIAQPAHRFDSYTTWRLTQRVWGGLVHLTHFVECGPLTIFHRTVFMDTLPFPETRWAWGLDVMWGEIARRRNFRIGVVDATPMSHLRPVAQVYDSKAAVAEARQLLASQDIHRSNREILRTTAILNRL